jgi:hypothetical protein
VFFESVGSFFYREVPKMDFWFKVALIRHEAILT